MELYITNEGKSEDKQCVRNKLVAYNYAHFPDELKSKYQEVNLFVKDAAGQTFGGLVGEICWNWLEVHYLIVDESVRGKGYGKKLLAAAEELAREKGCDFIKLDTLSFQALDFYKMQAYEVYGVIENAGGFTHYYLKKDL
ncbi:GNAT family N-acetyltransferase [Brevibacillus reuszeri]|uniref:GNAT family N-acetyltransferase n=1 Tax=Brevibacillus reuszeri TaxID=54915 RepID=UPI0028A15B3F|nr:GNAT family N-acetyltransferase [Brevibacillus reuszeri]